MGSVKRAMEAYEGELIKAEHDIYTDWYSGSGTQGLIFLTL